MMKSLFIILFLSLFIGISVEAQGLKIQLENDLIAGSDTQYTHGTRIYYESDFIYKDKIWGVASFLFQFLGSDQADTQFGYAFGQNIYTPEDISEENYIPGDRRYSAWLYGGIYIRKNKPKVSDYLELQMGVIGPNAMGEEVQTAVHKASGATTPMGWDHQLDNELGAILIYRRSFMALPSGWSEYFQLVPYCGGCVGNIAIYSDAGVEVRMGFNLPKDFGPSVITPSFQSNPSKNSFYVFGGSEGRFIVRNIFLDGNTFKDNGGVDKEPFVYDCYSGAGIKLGAFSLKYTFLIRSEEFESQPKPESFGSIVIGFWY